jgi:hypothetical protein
MAFLLEHCLCSTTTLPWEDHRWFIEAAIAWFHRTDRIPVENIMLAEQRCGVGTPASGRLHLPRVGAHTLYGGLGLERLRILTGGFCC